jgi:predicted outer membrane protein
MRGTGFFRALQLTYILLIAWAGRAQQIYPAAMTGEYQPLRWQGDDARFGLDMLHGSYCTAAVSATVAAKTQNQAVQTVALKMAQEQRKMYRHLHTMAQTFEVPIPPKRDLYDCPGNSRMGELSGKELDSTYVHLLMKTASANVSRFETELEMAHVPSNWTLWNFAKKTLPMMLEEKATINITEQRLLKGQ